MQQESAFRTNFVINLLNTLLNLVAGIAGLAILFGQVQTFQGWTFPQVLALLGIYLAVNALRNLVIGPSLDTLGGMEGEIWDGRFDFTLLKPVHTQFLISFRSWRMWSFVDLLLSLTILGIALSKLGQQLDLPNMLLFVLSLTISLTIVYSISLLLTSGMFWYQGVPLIWIFDSLIQLGRYPVGIYPGWLKLLLTWIVPIGFITTVPAKTLAGQVPMVVLLGGATLAIGLLIVASIFFRVSLRRYSSASS